MSNKKAVAPKKIIRNQVSIRLSRDEVAALKAAALASGRVSISSEVRYQLFTAKGK